MSVIESRRNTNDNSQHFVVQIGTGYNFEKGSSISFGKKMKLERAGKISKEQQSESLGYYAVPSGLKTAKPGDKIWLIKSEDNQHAFAVATIVNVSSQRLFTDTEMGWNREGSECPHEVIYTNLINVRDCQIQVIKEQPGMCIVRNYKNSVSITANLPYEYTQIQIYRHARLGL
jgi:hypothetical protein